MDDINSRLLEVLHRDASLTRSELGKRVGLPLSGLRRPLRSFASRRRWDRLKKTVEVTALEVFECHRVTGERLLCDELRLPFIGDLEELANRFSPFGRTITSIVNSTPVPRQDLIRCCA